MKTSLHNLARDSRSARRGAVLVIVMWIAFGLISLALYFGHSMSFELRASDNRVAGAEAEQAIEGAARYISLILSNNPGIMPDIRSYQSDEVPVGDATFWIIGRADSANASISTIPTFGLIDEASKLNLNSASLALTNLELLPRMTADLAASIKIWQGKTNDTAGTSGATDQTYATLKPPYYLKGSNFESVAELRLVYGMNMDVLYGEDANFNGILDQQENDGDTLPPTDNRDGRLDPGLVEYLTVYTSDPNKDTNGSPRIDINDQNALRSLLTSQFSQQKANQVIGAKQGTNTSVAQFYARVQNVLTLAEFEQIADYLAVNTNSPLKGLVNVNTAREEVLACLDGFTADMASQLVTYRRSNPDNLRTIAWVATVLGTNVPASARLLTTHSYQFTADIAAVGHHDRGYRRVRFVFDTSTGTPQIIYRQDLSHLGWALGRDIREQMLTAKETR